MDHLARLPVVVMPVVALPIVEKSSALLLF